MTDRFAHVSGSAALDVLNTVSWRRDPRRAVEHLGDANAVLAWCREGGLLDAEEASALAAQAAADPRRAETAALRFREAREVVHATVVEHDPGAIEQFSEELRGAVAAAVLVPDGDGRWVWRDQRLTLSTPRHRVVRAIGELLRSDRIALLHRCEDAECGWVYLDTSPRRNRRWCAAADCGDRNRARAYYQRQKAARS